MHVLTSLLCCEDLKAESKELVSPREHHQGAGLPLLGAGDLLSKQLL